MCGRYTIISKPKEISKTFGVEVNVNLIPQYNAVPSYWLPVISDQSPQELSLYRWGLIPNWANDEKFAYKTTNARSESILEKASFKVPIRQKRCLVLANCYFEWQQLQDKSKQPYLIYYEPQRLFAMAGIWDSWIDKNTGEEVKTFSIITTAGNEDVKHLHERMPVILPVEKQQEYLSKNTAIEQIQTLLKPTNLGEMKFMPVSNLVNSPANNDKSVLQPIEL
ncbi:MAG: putative SOS response-associated peptidase YedK [Arenicella sp.]|jgi:putative SOS response-associated peptidase YedK